MKTAAVSLLALVCLSAVASAAAENPLKDIDIAGNEFTGKLTINRFSKTKDKGVIAEGLCSGTLTSDGSTVESTPCHAVVQSVNGKEAGKGRKLLQTCDVLTLVLSGLFLDVLGLQVIIPTPVIVIIQAVAGAGNLLGNLLCAVANLLNGGGPLSAVVGLLNQIIGALTAALG